MTTDEMTILELERLRCQAVVARDIAVLDSMLADDMIHIHGTGLVEDKPAYLREMQRRTDCRSSRRENVKVRFYGDIAVCTGDVFNEVRPLGSEQAFDQVHARATIVWAKLEGGWKLASFHASLAGQH